MGINYLMPAGSTVANVMDVPAGLFDAVGEPAAIDVDMSTHGRMPTCRAPFAFMIRLKLPLYLIVTGPLSVRPVGASRVI